MYIYLKIFFFLCVQNMKPGQKRRKKTSLTLYKKKRPRINLQETLNAVDDLNDSRTEGDSFCAHATPSTSSYQRYCPQKPRSATNDDTNLAKDFLRTMR